MNFSGVITVYYYKHAMSCRGYVYPAIKLKFNGWININVNRHSTFIISLIAG